MIGRRELVKSTLVGLSLAMSSQVSACSPAPPPEGDTLGPRLKAYFETGDDSPLKGLFDEDTNLVFFDGLRFSDSFGYAYVGQNGVTKALKQLRLDLTKEGYGAPCKFVSASFEGALEDFGPNKLKLCFEEPNEVETSCGMSKMTRDVEILYARAPNPELLIGSMAVLPPVSKKLNRRG